MEISLLTLLIGLALGTFALGFIFARLAKLSRLSSPARQFATEGAHASTPATPEPEDVLTATQLHYQQTHINSLNTNIRLLEEKLRWAEQDRVEADEAIADLQRHLKAAKAPRGDEVTQREAELALLRAQLDAAINSASKLERKAIRAEHDAHAANEENQQLRSKLWAQQSTDVALSRLQDRQTALQAAINENQLTRDRLAGEVVTLNAALAEREALLADRDSMLTFADRKLREKEEDYARLVARENTWEKQQALLADTQAMAAQAERERDEARHDVAQLRVALGESGAQIQLVSERLHALHEAMALRDAQVTELHGELRRLQGEHAATSEHRDSLREELTQTIAGAEANEKELRAALARSVSAVEETRTMLRLRDGAVTEFEVQLALAEQRNETLEMALLLATANLTALREEMNDAEAGRMLLEAELDNKTQALAVATDDLAQLSSREYELTVALERTGREHQSSLETVLLHVNKIEDALAKAHVELAEKREQTAHLAGQLRDVEIALQVATQQAQEREDELAALQAALQQDEEALAAARKHAGEQDEEVNALLLARNTLETHLQAKTAVLATAEAVIVSMREQLAERDHELADLRILANERARELESAQAQVAYLTEGLDDLNNTANEKFTALQAAQAALNVAQTANEVSQAQIAQLTHERITLASEISAAQKQIETLSGENAGIHAELSVALSNAAQLQTELDEVREQLAQAQAANAAVRETIEAQAGEIIALANAKSELESALKLAEARVADLALALENAGARQAGVESRLQESTIALETLRDEHAALLKARAAGDVAVKTLTAAIAALEAEKAVLEAQLQESAAALEAARQQHETATAQAETRIAQLASAAEAAAGERLALEIALRENESRLENVTASLTELRQAHATLLQEHDVLRRAGDALEAQTRHQMETLVEISNASALLHQQLQERDSALLAAQVALAQAQQSLAAKPEPGTLEAKLIDTTLTLQRLEREFAALQAEKDAIEDEYTREGIAGKLRMTEKERELRECGARVDALELQIALLKPKDS
jgi:chromosome segregation ATPase